MSGLAPWTQKVFERVSSLNADDRLPHALLIDGPGGWGEAQLAGQIALTLIDRSSDPRTTAHPDFRWIEPEKGTIKVDQIRSPVSYTHLTLPTKA